MVALKQADSPETAKRLLELQELDSNIMRLTKRLEDMPEKRAILQTRKKRVEVDALLQKAKLLSSRLEKDISRLDDECRSLGSRIDTEQAKVMSGSVTNPKELVAITREMDSLKRRRDKLEVDEVILMQKAEKATAQTAVITKALDQLAKQEEDQKAQFVEVGSKVQDETARLTVQRTRIAGSLPADILARYDEIAKAKGGVAIGHLDGKSCSACRMQLPAEETEKLHKGPALATCPACRRMLVVDLPGGEVE